MMKPFYFIHFKNPLRSRSMAYAQAWLLMSDVSVSTFIPGSASESSSDCSPIAAALCWLCSTLCSPPSACQELPLPAGWGTAWWTCSGQTSSASPAKRKKLKPLYGLQHSQSCIYWEEDEQVYLVFPRFSKRTAVLATQLPKDSQLKLLNYFFSPIRDSNHFLQFHALWCHRFFQNTAC